MNYRVILEEDFRYHSSLILMMAETYILLKRLKKTYATIYDISEPTPIPSTHQ